MSVQENIMKCEIFTHFNVLYLLWVFYCFILLEISWILTVVKKSKREHVKFMDLILTIEIALSYSIQLYFKIVSPAVSQPYYT